MSSQQERKEKEIQFLRKELDGIMKEMLVDVLKEKPANMLDFIFSWVSKKRDAKGATPGIEVKEPAKSTSTGHSTSTFSDEEEDDFLDPAEIKGRLQKGNKPRSSVSAEVYGKYNIKKEYVPVVVPKSAEQKAEIAERLKESFIFKMLDDSDKSIVIDAMKLREFKRNDYVIKQGDDGNELFLVGTGTLNCYKKFGAAKNDTFLLTYKQGMAFGELSLLYNAPRAASIVANEDCVLWSLDRECFNSIVKESSIKRRKRFEAFLPKIELLKDLDPYESQKLSDVLVTEKYSDGDYIIKQGETGTIFFFIETGEAVATKTKDGKEEIVYEYGPNDYFGELALIKDQPRAANVVAKGDIQVCTLDRKGFNRLLGPLSEVLKRNTERYAKYMKKQ